MQVHHTLKQIPFTRSAYEQMQRDVWRLEKEHDEVVVRLSLARQEGDLSENGAYKYAKFELGRIRRELGRLRNLLKTGFIVEAKHHDVVEFGTSVTLVSAGKRTRYMVVSEHESNPIEGKLSMKSPLGEALLGKRLGESVTVTTPRGEQSFTIEALE